MFRKTIAALSGLFLVFFLIGHLLGNLQLFIPGEDGKTRFNEYALFMTTNPAVNILSILTYSSIILHIIITLYLALKSSQARPVQYTVSSGNSNSSWSSKNMSILGVFILFFIIVHMKSFWFKMHFGDMPYQYLSDGTKIKDLYEVTVSAFNDPFYTFFYVFSMIVLSFHLRHGIESAIQTMGIKTLRYENLFKFISGGIAFLIPGMFALIPIYLFIKQL
mgnify:FL=1